MTLLLTLAIFPLVGNAAARVLRLTVPVTRAARWSFLFLLGLGVQGALLYALGVCGVPLRVFAFAAIPVVSLFFLRRRTRAEEATDRDRLAALVFALPLIVLFLSASVIPTRDYDGRATWLPKARAIAIEGSIAGPFFQGQRGLNLHNRYPLLLPLDVATVMRLGGDTRNEAARWIYVLIPIAALVVLRGALCARFGSTGAWIAAVPPWLPLLTAIEGGALAAYNDFALAAFLGVAVLALLDAIDDPRALRTAGLFAAFALMTKNEGAALAVAVVIAASLVRGWKIIAPVALAEGIVVYWRTLGPAAYDERYEALLPALPRSIGRVPTALGAIARQAVQFSEWGVFWIAVVAAIVVCALLVRSRQFAMPLVTIAVALAAYVAALSVTSWRIEELAPVAVNRLLAQLLVPATWILALGVNAIDGIGRPSAGYSMNTATEERTFR
jgi:hypothetical protein